MTPLYTTLFFLDKHNTPHFCWWYLPPPPTKYPRTWKASCAWKEYLPANQNNTSSMKEIGSRLYVKPCSAIIHKRKQQDAKESHMEGQAFFSDKYNFYINWPFNLASLTHTFSTFYKGFEKEPNHVLELKESRVHWRAIITSRDFLYPLPSCELENFKR